MTNLGLYYTEANEALASVKLSVILPQNIFAMLNQIIFYCVAISRRVALQLPFVLPPPEKNGLFSTPIKRLFHCLPGLSGGRWGRSPAPSVSCWQCTRLSMRLFLLQIEESTRDTCTKAAGFAKFMKSFEFVFDGGHTTNRLCETTILGIKQIQLWSRLGTGWS